MIMDLSRYDPAHLHRIEQRMKGRRGRFLGDDDTLRGIVEEDRKTLDRSGLSYDQIADRLEGVVGTALYLHEIGLSGIERDSEWPVGIELSEQFRVGYRHWMGYQECHFDQPDGTPCDSTLYADTDFWIENQTSGITPRRIAFPGLIIHLIRDHHFFEGNVEYRLDPAEAASVLHIETGRSYQPARRTTVCWSAGDSPLEEGAIEWSIDDADSCTELAEGLLAYRLDEECVVVSTRRIEQAEVLRPKRDELFFVGISDPGSLLCVRHARDFAVDEGLLALATRVS